IRFSSAAMLSVEPPCSGPGSLGNTYEDSAVHGADEPGRKARGYAAVRGRSWHSVGSTARARCGAARLCCGILLINAIWHCDCSDESLFLADVFVPHGGIFFTVT